MMGARFFRLPTSCSLLSLPTITVLVVPDVSGDGDAARHVDISRHVEKVDLSVEPWRLPRSMRSTIWAGIRSRFLIASAIVVPLGPKSINSLPTGRREATRAGSPG